MRNYFITLGASFLIGVVVIISYLWLLGFRLVNLQLIDPNGEVISQSSTLVRLSLMGAIVLASSIIITTLMLHEKKN